MKKIIILIMLILLSSSMTFGFEDRKNIFGDTCFEKVEGNEIFKRTIAKYRFVGNEYEFFIGLYGEWARVYTIPEDLLDRNNNYYEKGKWKIEKKDGFEYLLLKSNNNFTIRERLGMLYHPKKLLLYDKDMLFFNSNPGIKYRGSVPRVVDVKMSSFLTEGKIKYNGNNYYEPYREKLRPWVEGVKGQGIGEWIELSTDSYETPVSFFLISNGYVSFEKPYLYKKNSRIKKMRITCKEENIDFVVGLKDTPDFQEIRLPKKITGLKPTFRFTIEEVYPGTKWEDTCLNLIIPLGDLPH